MTNKEKIQIYESLLHKIDAFILTGNNQKLEEALQAIRAWSYAHRSGNGELTEKEIKESIEWELLKLKEI